MRLYAAKAMPYRCRSGSFEIRHQSLIDLKYPEQVAVVEIDEGVRNS